jgi:hypothetical protein
MDEKSELIERIKEVLGVLPGNTSYILNVLVREDVIDATKAFIHIKDEGSRCEKFPAPWSCAKEAEAMYENIKYGWLGAAHGIGYSEWWCEPCRKRVMDG